MNQGHKRLSNTVPATSPSISSNTAANKIRSSETIVNSFTSPGFDILNVTGVYASNDTDHNSDSSDFNFTEWLVYTTLVIGCFIAILGFFANTITIIAYNRSRKLRTTFNFLIINLCTVDLLFSLLVIPPHLFLMASTPSILGQVGCVLLRYSSYFSISSSAINLVCIAMNRYVGIVHSKLYRKMFAKGYRKFWIIGVWLVPPLVYLPLLIVKSIRRTESINICGWFSPESDQYLRIYLVVLIGLLQVLPLVVLTAFYRAILAKVKKCRKTVEHHPLTNTPTCYGSYLGNSCAMKSTNSPENSPGLAQAPITRFSFRRGSSKRSDDEVACDKSEDINEGRKAIIMAYLEVPSASISPRKNPGALYKRSPPQTRTMIVGRDSEEINQVLISGTTSSPNLLDKSEEESYANSTRSRSTLLWCRQRSFSTGDEEIEPERGMVGDNESDLKQQTSFALTTGESIHSLNEESPHQKKQSAKVDEKRRHKGGGRKLLNSRSADSEPLVHEVQYGRRNKPSISTKSEPRVKSSTSNSFPSKLDSRYSLSGNYLRIPHPSTDCMDGVRLNETSIGVNRRRVRALTRQTIVNEEDLIITPDETSKNSVHMQKKISNQTSREGQPPDEAEKHMHKETSKEKPFNGVSPMNQVPDSPKIWTKIRDSNLSNLGYVARAEHFNTPNTMKGAHIASQIQNQEQTESTSKRFMYRRGGSDRTGARWLGRFRKSKNWSVTSMIPPKLKNRTNSQSQQNNVIKIVIDHATEEMSETWLGEEFDEPGRIEKDALSDVSRRSSSEYERKNLSIIPEQLTNPTDNSLDKKSSSECGISKETNVEKPSSGLWRSILKGKWKILISKSPLRRDTAREAAGTSKKCDTLVNSRSAINEKGENGATQETGKHTKQQQPCFSPELWSNIVEGTSTNKPVVMLPMPSIPMSPSPSVTKFDPSDSNAKQGFSLKIDNIDSGATPEEQSDCDDSARTSSNCAHRDSDLSSREDADLLRRRQEMNASTQFLRAQNAPCKFDDNQSMLDLNSVDLGRRWSMQSDALSIYSERITRPIERSHSNCSRYSQKRASRRSNSSDNQSGRRSFRRHWSSKKSSVASSAGSSFRRKRRRIAERKLAYSGISICIAFALCMLPTSTVDIMRKLTTVHIPPEIEFSLMVLSWAHVVTNPFLYGFLNSQFRKEYKRMGRDFVNFVTGKNRRRGLLSGRSAIIQAMREQYQDQDSVNQPQSKKTRKEKV